MNRKMRSCVMGLILGLFSSPLPEVQKEPIAYLYNGVRLPALPEYDKEAYPYAHINNPMKGYYFLIVGSEPVYAGGNYLTYEKSSHVIRWDTEGDAWDNIAYQDRDAGDTAGGRSSLLWCNYDIYHVRNTGIYKAASEPIPVYE